MEKVNSLDDCWCVPFRNRFLWQLIGRVKDKWQAIKERVVVIANFRNSNAPDVTPPLHLLLLRVRHLRRRRRRRGKQHKQLPPGMFTFSFFTSWPPHSHLVIFPSVSSAGPINDLLLLFLLPLHYTD